MAPDPSGDDLTEESTTGRLARTRAYRPWIPAPDLRRETLTDLGVSALLGVLVVQAFDPTYGGAVWVTTGVLGVVAGLLIAYVTIQLRTKPVVSVVATVLGIFVFGAQAVSDTATAGSIPGPATPAALFDGFTHGWARLLTTIPPVGTVDHLAAIVYLGGFVAAGGAFQLARRTRSTWLPLVPPITVLIAAVLVGTDEPASTIAQGAGVAIAAVVWLSLRGTRIRPRVHVVGASPWRRRLTGVAFLAVIVVGALGLTMIEPFAGPSQRFVLRRHTEPPFDPNAYPSSLASYPDWRQQSQKEPTKSRTVFTVKGLPKGVPIRMAVLDDYDGTVWRVGDDSGGESRSGSGHFVRVGDDLTAASGRTTGESENGVQPVTPANIRLDLSGYSDVWIPEVSGLSSLRFDGADSASEERDLRFNRSTGVAAVPSGLADGTIVTERAAVPEVSYIGSTRAGKARRSELVGDAPADPSIRPTAIPDLSGKGETVSIATIAQQLTSAASDDYAKALALETELSKKGQGSFSDGIATDNSLAHFRSGHNLFQMNRFLGTLNPNDPSKHLFVGNAERYAAAMAAMARKLDLPARVVVGFRADADDKKAAEVRDGNTTVFTPVQADAWVEIAFQGVGWVGFYPTPPRSQFDVPQETPQKQSSKPADVQAEPPVSPPPNPAMLQDRISKRSETPMDAASAFRIPAWVWLVLKVVGYPLLVVAVIVGLITGYKRQRRKRRRTRGSPVDRVAGAWAEMMDQLRDLGARVPRAGTRREIAGAIGDESWGQLPGFAAGVDAAMFGPDDPDDASVASIWEWVDAERGKLFAGLRRRHRWKARLNVRSLRGWR